MVQGLDLTQASREGRKKNKSVIGGQCSLEQNSTDYTATQNLDMSSRTPPEYVSDGAGCIHLGAETWDG